MAVKLQTVKAIIAEYDKNIRQLIKSHLAAHPEITIVNEVSTGAELLKTVGSHNPSVVFLDIEMPDFNGLSAAASIKKNHPQTGIVFITAHTKYAAEAFQLEAIDYLIKPITAESVSRAVEKIKKYTLPGKISSSSAKTTWLTIKNGFENYFVNIEDIIYIEREGHKTIIHTVRKPYETVASLTTLNIKLGSDFFRCHKSFIINIKKMEKVFPIADRVYKVEFYNYSGNVTMSRKKLDELYGLLPSIAI